MASLFIRRSDLVLPPHCTLLLNTWDGEDLEFATEFTVDTRSRRMACNTPYALVALTKSGGDQSLCVWGVVPYMLIHARKGVVRLSECMVYGTTAPPVPCVSRRMAYYHPRAVADMPHFCLDDVDGLVHERLQLYRALYDNQAHGAASPSAMLFPATRAELERDALAYTLVAYAASMPCLTPDLIGEHHPKVVWLRGEMDIALHRMAWQWFDFGVIAETAWAGGRTADGGLRGMFGSTDESETGFHHALRASTSLEGGMVHAPLVAWSQDLLNWYVGVHRANLRAQVERKRISHPHLNDLMQRANRRLAVAAWVRTRNPRPVGSGTCSAVQIRDIEALVDVMPGCMARLHHRATAVAADDGHIKYRERRAYFEFMGANGISDDALMAVQAPVHATHSDSAAYTNAIHGEVRGATKWARRVVDGGDFTGTSCKTMHAEMRHVCPYTGTVGQAQHMCQHFRARKLGRDETDKPAGTPFRYTQTLRLELDQPKLTVAMETD